MPLLWRLAWRNLWRHRTRTVIMISAVALTYALMLVGIGIGDDSHARMLAEATRAAGGDVLIHGRGYWDTRAGDVVVPDGAAVLDVVDEVPGVAEAIPRILVNGLLSSPSGNRPVLLRAVDPVRERALSDPSEDLVGGSFLSGDARAPLVLGAGLVEELDVELGDRVVLTASGPDGEVTRALFHLSGVTRTGIRELDEAVGYTTLEASARAVGMEGMLTQVGVLLEPDEDVGVVAARIGDALARTGAGSAELEVLTWPEAVPEMVGFIELDDAFGYIYMAVIFVVVLFSITNTFLMAVMERVRELGLLSALGLRGSRIGRLLLAETLLLTALAMTVGFSLGFGGHLAAAHWGIDVSMWGVEELEISGVDLSELVMYSRIAPVKWVLASLFVAAATLGSALYPAWRATRLAPAEAMRFYE